MAKKAVDTAAGAIGQQVGSALDSLVQPAHSVVNSVREVVSSALSGMAGFMKEPSDKTATPRRAVARSGARR